VKIVARTFVVVLLLTVGASACGETEGPTTQGTGAPAPIDEGPIDYKAIGLWDDGPCDPAKPPLKIGLMTVFESGVISLGDQADSLEASATAFNNRGGANGSCIEVHTCDDKANLDQSLACVREIDEAGVVATVNDQGTVGQAEVSAAMSEAGIPRLASLPTPQDWADPNTYPLDAGGTGVAFLLPQALIDIGVPDIGVIRVDFAQASALKGFLESIYGDDGVTFPVDVAVPPGTTDYSQFLLAAQNGGAEGAVLALGEQEAVQVMRAGEQLGSDLRLGASLGSFPHATISQIGDFAGEMAFAGTYPPATVDLPVYQALRADFTASGKDALQPANVEASPMRSWIGLYALLWMIRDSGTTTFTRDGITAMLDSAKDVPMLDMYGGENWTPALDHPGAFKRAGMNTWVTWKWDAEATAPGGLSGNFVQVSTINFDKVLCGSPIGGPPPC
jgi:ABC-type branched-subunit amino acid transport system substrate-binding protein